MTSQKKIAKEEKEIRRIRMLLQEYMESEKRRLLALSEEQAKEDNLLVDKYLTPNTY